MYVTNGSSQGFRTGKGMGAVACKIEITMGRVSNKVILARRMRTSNSNASTFFLSVILRHWLSRIHYQVVDARKPE